jgi:hypothetical protein
MLAAPRFLPAQQALCSAGPRLQLTKEHALKVHRSLWTTVLCIGLIGVVCAGLAPAAAKADEIAALSATGANLSWSFDVPATGILKPSAAIAIAGTISDGGKSSGVPEPSSLLLLGSGLASVYAWRHRRMTSRRYVAYQEHGKRAIRLE